MIKAIVIAILIAVIVGFLLSVILGPLLLSIGAPPTDVLGHAFRQYGWGIGVVVGLWYFFTGGSWTSINIGRGT